MSQDFATQLTFISEELNRVVAVLLNRQNQVEWVMLGDSERVFLPDIGRQRAGAGRFRGLRLVRTTLDREAHLSHDDLADLSKLRLDMVLTIGVGPGGYPGAVEWAHLLPDNPEGKAWEVQRATADDVPYSTSSGCATTHSTLRKSWSGRAGSRSMTEG